MHNIENEKSTKIFSFFSGCGMLDLGFEDTDFDVCFVNEFDNEFLRAYKHTRKLLKSKEPDFGYFNDSIEVFLDEKRKFLSKAISDVRKEGNIVGFIGGPPCPDFSVGGKNKGRYGVHGNLSQIYVDVIKQQNPDFFLFENVKGLWRTKIHRAFYEELKVDLIKDEYIIFDRLINAIEFGAPQDRARVIMIGVSKKLIKKSFLNQHDKIKFPWEKFMKFPGNIAFNFNWPTQEPFYEDKQVSLPNGIPAELTVQHWFDKNKVHNHPNSNHYFKPRAGLARFLSVNEGDDSKKSFKRLHRWRYSPTACYGNNLKQGESL
jgi:DNA (cytosine-5)-methyltransferase 1